MARLHNCSVPGCKAIIPLKILMCKLHWFEVPPLLRDEIKKCWRASKDYAKSAVEREAYKQRHKMACFAAVNILDEWGKIDRGEMKQPEPPSNG